MANTLIEHNPLLKPAVLKILALCEQCPDAHRDEIEALATTTAGKTFVRQTPTTVVDILLRNGALAERVLVNGEIYPGKLQDMQIDSNVDDNARIEQYLSLTEDGSELLDDYRGDKKLQILFAEKPHYIAIYQRMLAACTLFEGCSRASLEQVIEEKMALVCPEELGSKKVYPQYFIDSLETAGGITWQSSWQTTQAGKVVMKV